MNLSIFQSVGQHFLPRGVRQFIKSATMPLNAQHIFPAATDPNFTAFPSRRSVVHSTKGIVSSTQPLASQAGVQILQKGGNAAVSLLSRIYNIFLIFFRTQL
jgi:hypothetical protein